MNTLSIDNTKADPIDILNGVIRNEDPIEDLIYQSDHNVRLTCSVFNLLGKLITTTETLKTLRIECSSYPMGKDDILEALCYNDTIENFTVAFTRSEENIRPFYSGGLCEMIKWNTCIKKLKLLNVKINLEEMGKAFEHNDTIKELVMMGVKGDMSLFTRYKPKLERLCIHNSGFLYERSDCMCGKCGIYDTTIEMSAISSIKKVKLINVKLVGELDIPEGVERFKCMGPAYNPIEMFKKIDAHKTLKRIRLGRYESFGNKTMERIELPKTNSRIEKIRFGGESSFIGGSATHSGNIVYVIYM